MVSAKTFATLYAGREARYEGKKVRVVGYYRVSNTKPMRVIITGLKGGWKYEDVKNDPAHVFTCRVQAGRIRYATVKEFAEKNAGKYFLYGVRKVRVVGYRSYGNQILATLPGGTKSIGWGRAVLDQEDILVISTRASKFWYVDIEELK